MCDWIEGIEQTRIDNPSTSFYSWIIKLESLYAEQKSGAQCGRQES